jgi:hypothetical protein
MLKFFVADPDPGSGAFFTLDLGSKTKKSDPGLNVLDLQQFKKGVSATVIDSLVVHYANAHFTFSNK